MALKTSNKNRKKVEQHKVEQIQKENAIFTKKFIKYYSIAFVILTLLFLII